MVTSLGNERTATLPGKGRIALALAALVVMSGFTTSTSPTAVARPTATPPVTPAANNVHPTEIVNTVSAPAPPVRAAIIRRPTVFTRLTKLTSGLASWYGEVLQGHTTASGRTFDKEELTAAHRTLPFGSKVKVTDLRNRRSVIVTITDRGVLNADRVIDLSLAAARELGMVRMGVDPVKLELLARQATPAIAH